MKRRECGLCALGEEVYSNVTRVSVYATGCQGLSGWVREGVDIHSGAGCQGGRLWARTWTY